jgi:hypothetical protein
MLTIFSCPKPFKGHINVIQTNAIRSWTRLRPKPEVILLGNDEGTAEVCARFEIRHIPDIQRNEYGTPLLNSLFEAGQESASNTVLGFVNTDIILLDDFTEAVSRVAGRMQSFLMVGQRWNLDVTELLNFETPGFGTDFRSRVLERGELNPKTGIDYFIYRKECLGEIPPFALGRSLWDNYLIYHARAIQRIPVVDATDSIMAVHQNHDYSHIAGGRELAFKGIEAMRNKVLTRDGLCVFDLDYASHLLTTDSLKPARACRHFWRRLAALPIIYFGVTWPIRLGRGLIRFYRFLKNKTLKENKDGYADQK